jgi:plasmid maintenance system antidote protein VapI
MPMKNPPHPGRSIRNACLEPLGLTVTQAAGVLGIARHMLSRVLAGHWLRLQTAHDLAKARLHEADIKVRRYEPRPAA